MKSKIFILSTLLILTACGRPELASFTPEVDHSESIVSEEALRESGCVFELSGYRALLSCEEKKTILAYYEQRAAIAEYLWANEKIDIKDTATTKNQKSALTLQMKRMTATISDRFDRTVSSKVAELSGEKSLQRLFYQLLFETMKRDQVVVAFSADGKSESVLVFSAPTRIDERTKEAIAFFEAKLADSESEAQSDPDLQMYRSTLDMLKGLGETL